MQFVIVKLKPQELQAIEEACKLAKLMTSEYETISSKMTKLRKKAKKYLMPNTEIRL